MAQVLQNLPQPEVFEAVDYEVILADLLSDVRARLLAAGIDYDVGMLETDPVKIVVEASAFREMLLRARINDAARSNLLLYAQGADLEHLAGFYDVVRLDGETDDALRRRVIAAIIGRSTAGPADWYRAAALRSSPRVRDAAVYRGHNRPDVYVSVLAADNFGEADQALLDAVRTVVTADDVRVISDRVEVVPATAAIIDVAADIWLHPDAPQTVFDNLEATLRKTLAGEGGLGFDVTRSWLIATLHQPGVQRVELAAPTHNLVMADYQAAKFGVIDLTYQGRAR
ncbi:baseplate J/gp47 family protein [Nitratireductor sp.]|uniref:baseplate assembly protein n=1 Tax=Nitratireductor sp. TaxID=1872084 RepID=UPI00261F3228|nr:baseplate J/gp47 family protein [Nitratireductor sp.]MCV0378997.1 baseplate J/gp47 family protein [Nitratireductor sp.]